MEWRETQLFPLKDPSSCSVENKLEDWVRGDQLGERGSRSEEKWEPWLRALAEERGEELWFVMNFGELQQDLPVLEREKKGRMEDNP